MFHSILQSFRLYINYDSYSYYECQKTIIFFLCFQVFIMFTMVENEFTLVDLFSIGIMKVWLKKIRDLSKLRLALLKNEKLREKYGQGL